MHEHDIFRKPAIIASAILGGCALIVMGMVLAQTAAFQATWQEWKSGGLSAEMLPYARDALDKQLTVWQDTPDGLQGGAVLIGSNYTNNPALVLVGGEGKMLHRWQVEPEIINREALQWWKELPPTDRRVFALDDAALLPNGDVIFIQTMPGFDNDNGQRLARMDKDSHIRWQVVGDFHHELDIAGTSIYAIASTVTDALPVIGPQLPHSRYLDEHVEQYDTNGKKINSWSVTDAFAHSAYRDWLASFAIDIDEQRAPASDGRVLYDPLHLNSVQYLDAAHAAALPSAQAGDLLLTLRGLNAIAVLRPSENSIVWVSRGPWNHPHHARVLDDGKLYLFDNDGSTLLDEKQGMPQEKLQSRVLRYDPLSHSMQVIFASPGMHSRWRGYYQPLSNGAWLIASPEHSRVIVTSPEQKILWELRGVPDRKMDTVPYRKQLSTVRYYPPDALAFLKAAP